MGESSVPHGATAATDIAVAASNAISAAVHPKPEDQHRSDGAAGGGAAALMQPAAGLGAGGGGGGGGNTTDVSDVAEDDGSVARLSFVGPVGLVAPQPSLTPSQLAEGLAEAAAFVRDWSELRAVSRNRLYGAVLERYFQDALEAITNEAVAAGAYGTSTSRYVQGVPVKIPEGATLQPVQVRTDAKYGSGNSAGTAPAAAGTGPGAAAAPGWRMFHQAFLADGRRLCLNCAKPVQDCSLPASTPLDTSDYLFCDPHCETGYFVKGSGSALRRTLARLEHGVCQMCGLDCTNLVRQLQTIRTTSRDFLAKRRAVVERLAPRLTRHGYTALLERLLRTATEGFAWQADHITPVYAGGGLCDVDNMRTLCVACHLDVTKAQCKQRAAERQQRRYGTKDIRTFCTAQNNVGGLPPMPPSKRRPDPWVGLANRRRRPAVNRSAYIDTSDDSPARPTLLAAAAAVAAAAAADHADKRAMKGRARGGGSGGASGVGGKALKGSTKAVPFVPLYDDDDNVWEFKVIDLADSDGDGAEGKPGTTAQVADATADVVQALLTEVVDLAGSDEGEENSGDGDKGLAATSVSTAVATCDGSATENPLLQLHLLPPSLPLQPSLPLPPPEKDSICPATSSLVNPPLPTSAVLPQPAPSVIEEVDGGGGHSVPEAVSETTTEGGPTGFWAGRLRERVKEGRGADGGGTGGSGGDVSASDVDTGSGTGDSSGGPTGQKQPSVATATVTADTVNTDSVAVRGGGYGFGGETSTGVMAVAVAVAEQQQGQEQLQQRRSRLALRRRA
ncbi:hypothetical protein VaNZ11_001003 [Volvox africanus]|uniref:HNH domain-containing protein n=1 Tax=Volvox africanus TaxID=51714 RepID=A0ABQ5RNZ6_9CHLO|nr:hypothetical protein VaNZ11_001003 [Volvox africanus]